MFCPESIKAHKLGKKTTQIKMIEVGCKTRQIVMPAGHLSVIHWQIMKNISSYNAQGPVLG